MQVAVWDTYVKTPTGDVLHFDIVVPESDSREEVVYNYGRRYLQSRGMAEVELSAGECRFCHMEQPEAAIQKAIREHGYYIYELDTIPAVLPDKPARRDLILHLRGHFPQYRFADFKDKTEEELMAIILRARGEL
ncbi:MAG: hypothetical protein KatS3mg031_1475 [Chitinophagales bacterium]|nr:MAG: hypothetical protein KatS3mg031_1475 [Chitinophagales bacterium]